MRLFARTSILALVALVASLVLAQPIAANEAPWTGTNALGTDCPFVPLLFGADALSFCAVCGDGVCEPFLETCSSCQADCGACPPPPCLSMPWGMAAWWPFEETAATAFSDLIGGNTAYKNGGISTINGKVGKAAFFDGTNDYLRVHDSADVDFSTGDHSIVFWARVHHQDGGALLDKHAPGSTWGYGYSVHIAWWPSMWLFDGGDAPSFFDTSFNSDDGRWHLYAFTVDRNQSNGWRLYVDGTLRASGDPRAAQGTVSNSIDLIIGNHVTLGANGFWRGSLDELQIYKRVLTSTEVRNIYNRGSSGVCQPSAPTTCPGGSSCTMDIQCGYTTSYGLLGGCYSGTCLCK